MVFSVYICVTYTASHHNRTIPHVTQTMSLRHWDRGHVYPGSVNEWAMETGGFVLGILIGKLVALVVRVTTTKFIRGIIRVYLYKGLGHLQWLSP